jgi:type IV secretion system protein VirB6
MHIMIYEIHADVLSAFASSYDLIFNPKVSSIGDVVFFALIYDYLHEAIGAFRDGIMDRMVQLITLVSLVVLSVWVFFQGLRIVTGQSRDSMMALVINSLRATLIVAAAAAFGVGGDTINEFITEDLQKTITVVITGEEDSSPKEMIDENLTYMQIAMSSIDAVQVLDNEELKDRKTQALFMVAGGTAGPAMTGAAMLLLYEVAMALFIGLGPLFILCLLFDASKSLFSRWLMYGLGTMFSMAVLAAMVVIATKVVTAVSIAFWVTSAVGGFLDENFNSGITSVAIQQGGIGLLLTVLIISTPPMAANFFQGTLGNFMPYAQISSGSGATGSRPGESGYRGGGSAAPADLGSRDGGDRSGLTSSPAVNAPNQRVAGAGQDQPKQTPGSRGVANQGGRE